MPTEVRRVIAGINSDGKSTIVADSPATAILGTDESPVVLVEIWKTAESPAENVALSPDGHDGEGWTDPVDGPVKIVPDTAVGSLFRICEFPPMSSVTGDWNASFAAMGQDLNGSDEHASDTGYHSTDSIDYIVMLDGEITCMFEDGEVVLRPGDCFVQRGTKHAWENRGTVPARFTSILVGAVPR